MDKQTALKSLAFISLKDVSLHFCGDFAFDTSIPLPVQLNSGDQARFNTADLTAEQIFAGILTLLAYVRDHKHIDYYRKLLLAARPGIRTEMTEAGILKAKNGDFELAEEVFMALEGINPADTLTTLNLALLHDEKAATFRETGRETEADDEELSARLYYNQTMLSDPPIPDAFFNAGFFYTRINDYAKAKNCLETYISIATDESKKQEAESLLKTICTHSLDDAVFLEAYRLLQTGSGTESELSASMEKTREFLEKHPKVWNGWFLLGWALRKSQRWADAAEAFKTALALDADIPDTANELAICLMEIGNFDEARQYLYDALKSQSNNTKVISNLGFLALKQNNFDEAAGFFKTVLEINPEDEIATEMLRKLEV